MTPVSSPLGAALRALLQKWRKDSLPPTTAQALAEGENLSAWKETQQLPGLWEQPPILLTATLDDGWGIGLKPIRFYADLAGLTVNHLGLLVPATDLITACQSRVPDLLGLTVLHFDTEEIICRDIAEQIPPTTAIIAGGPVFKAFTAEELAAKPYRVIKNLPDFIDFLLTYP